MKGSIVTKNDAPVSSVQIAIHYDPKYISFGGKDRTIETAESNEKGNYNMRFHLRDNEIGENADGFFRVTVDLFNLETEKYLVAKNVQLGEAIYTIGTRDTIIEQSYYIPTKAFVKVNLNNFNPIQEGDIFEVRTLYPYGLKIGNNDFLNSEYQTGSSEFDEYMARKENEIFNEVKVAEGEENVIRIIKIKNGIAEPKETRIFIPENNTIELTYEY